MDKPTSLSQGNKILRANDCHNIKVTNKAPNWSIVRHGCYPDVKIKFKDFQSPNEGYGRSKLNKNRTYISIPKRFNNLTLLNINKQNWSRQKVTKCINSCLSIQLLWIAFRMSHLSHYLHYLQGHVCDLSCGAATSISVRSQSFSLAAFLNALDIVNRHLSVKRT